MTAREGGYVCPACGERAEFLNEDGSKATFMRPRPSRGFGWGSVLLAVLAIAGLGGAGYAAVRFDVLGRLSPASGPQAVLPATPEIRTGVTTRFAAPLRENLIASFGTPGDDEALGLALFADARLGVLVLTKEGDPALWFVSVDGTDQLKTRRLEVSGKLRSAALIAGPDDLAAAMIAGDSGLQVLGLGAGGERLWGRSWQGLDLAEGDAVIASDTQSVLVLAKGSAPGTRVAAMLDGNGGLVWQRTFPSGEAAGAWAAVDGEAVWLAWPAPSGSGTTLARLSRAGDTELEIGLGAAPQHMAGLVAASDGSVRVLVSNAVPEVAAYASSGEQLWRAEVRSALLNDRMSLVRGDGDEARVVSSYRLSDVQTDLAVTSLSAAGEVKPLAVARLPAGTALGGVASFGEGRMLAAVTLPEEAGGRADAVLLAVDAAPAASQPAPVQSDKSPAPVAPESQSVEPAASSDAPASVDCEFVCRSAEGLATISQEVFEADTGAETDLRAIQAVICQASGGVAELGSAPTCAPAP
ncbi:hypothetical protein [Hyphomonas sp.]|uniref:hypothetical protein n=1 Tax=Hyphomonas sp. TaxID=87 RepID=UPI0025B99C9C|nr:hypothetical protein [Hyphomonas sp.]